MTFSPADAPVTVRRASDGDRDALWAILEAVVRSGETYPFPRDWSREETLDAWFAADKTVFVAERDGAVLGTYYRRANAGGAGAHVANCGYAVGQDAQGQGIASTLCAHSLMAAGAAGFRAMQFNLVVSTNERAVALWHRHGFRTVGTLPGVFDHPRHGFVDAYVMHRDL